jgi:Uma2 family endonuclease
MTQRFLTGESTRRLRWIVTLQGGLDSLFRNRRDVLVAGSVPWFLTPESRDSATPDLFVAMGVARGERTAYRQWEESNIVPQVVFDIIAPGTSMVSATRRLKFYERAGVEEYYMYDPDAGEVIGWVHNGIGFDEVPAIEGWTSPRLNIIFGMEDGELFLSLPNGERFRSYVELAEVAERDHERAQQEHERAEQERARADYHAAREKMLIARLRALGFNPDEVTADNFAESIDTSETQSIG